VLITWNCFHTCYWCDGSEQLKLEWPSFHMLQNFLQFVQSNFHDSQVFYNPSSVWRYCLYLNLKSSPISACGCDGWWREETLGCCAVRVCWPLCWIVFHHDYSLMRMTTIVSKVTGYGMGDEGWRLLRPDHPRAHSASRTSGRRRGCFPWGKEAWAW